MRSFWLHASLALLPVVVTASFAACGSSGETRGSGGSAGGTTQGGAGGTTSGTTSGTGGDVFFDAGLSGDSGLDPDAACAAQSAAATLVKRPVDIIIVIDNSGSMTAEIQGVQNNVNQNFAGIIENSGLDYRVILVSRHGNPVGSQSVCVEAPLSGIAAGGCASPPGQPVNNPPRFFHYSTEIASRNSWCKILQTLTTPDEFNFAPTGWQEWLRADSFKTFIEITDDGVGCTFNGKSYQDSNTVAGGTTVAPTFDADLLAASPAHFGTAAERNYRFYSIVAMAFNTPATKPYEPTDPITASECPSAANPGTGHQALSVLTGGLRFPICDTTSYDAVFQAIAEGVIKGAKVACEFPVPEAPAGETIDLTTVQVGYTAGGVGPQTTFAQVPDATACTAGSFYIDADIIKLCPDACAVVQADDAAKIDVLFGCAGGVN